MKFKFNKKNVLITFLFIINSFAEYKSGYLEVMVAKDIKGIDFSELKDTCIFHYQFPTCSTIIADVTFDSSSLESLIAPYGIIDAGIYTTETALESIIIAPDTGYIRTAGIYLNHVYILKTSEGNYAAFHYYRRFIGDIEWLYFRWEYQTDGTTDLTPDVSIKETNNLLKKNDFGLKIFNSPNGLTFNWKPANITVIFSIYDLLGKKVKIISARGETGSFYWDTNKYGRGLYFLKSNISQGTINTLFIR